MLKKIGKMCGTAIIAFFIAVVAWYFILVELPEDALVQGSAAPTMSKEKAISLLNFHGVRVAYIKGEEWFFDRNGEAIPLKRRP